MGIEKETVNPEETDTISVKGCRSLINSVAQEAAGILDYRHSSTMLLLETAALQVASRVDNSLYTPLFWLSISKAGRIVFERLFGEYIFNKSLKIGKYLDLEVMKYRSLRSKQLSDGTIIQPGDKIGVFEFNNNRIKNLEPEDDFFHHIRDLYFSTKISFHNLALLCLNKDPLLEGVTAFYGVSHLAVKGAKIGFDVGPVSNPLLKLIVDRFGRIDEREVVSDHPMWEQCRKQHRTPMEAFISRKRLVELYGSQKIV